MNINREYNVYYNGKLYDSIEIIDDKPNIILSMGKTYIPQRDYKIIIKLMDYLNKEEIITFWNYEYNERIIDDKIFVICNQIFITDETISNFDEWYMLHFL